MSPALVFGAGEESAAVGREARAAMAEVAAFTPVLPKNVILPQRLRPPDDDGGADHAEADRAEAGIAEADRAEAERAPVPPEEPAEDVYPEKVRRGIQGNIIPGFNKDHQHLFFYRITDVAAAKKFLRVIRPHISSMHEVLEFVRAHRALRLRTGLAEPGLEATWVNIAFSRQGIEALMGPGSCDEFGELSFLDGLAARSTYLGDPTDPSRPGHRSRWKVGGPDNEADIVVIVASDTTTGRAGKIRTIRRWAATYGLKLIFEQRGDTLPGSLAGHEHFGFKDGVSQPGVRGKASSTPGDFITPRYLTPASADDERPRLFAKPGQPLLWPGQFLLGEPRQNPEHRYQRGTAATAFPSWAARGSYLVCRRLNQDVNAFWSFVAEAAASVGRPPISLAAALVGRWPSGAPVMRTPSADDAVLAGDLFANNHFLFDDDSRPSSMRPIPGYAGDAFAQARADMLGRVCPHFSHIRKANPRDTSTDLGKPSDTLIRMILRRGIPFGKPIVGVKRPSAKLVSQERGLMFLSYGATIEDQFEFLTRRWANSAIQPNVGGHDPLIGQRDQRGDRARFVDLPTASGPVRAVLTGEWVTPTGGGYFFAPPIDALVDVLGA